MKTRCLTNITLAVALALTVGTVHAQTPNLAGTWIMDPEKSGTKDGPPMIMLTQTETELSIRVGSETGRLMRFALDGKEREFSPGAKTRAIWKDGKLETTTITVERGTERINIFRDGLWLVAEVFHPETGPRKWYFKKQNYATPSLPY
jgi:hypothetical protein